ncbi:uncharacterized protein LOC135374008 isoform X2 [Ornithodoros turicata]|uniref:uncharacterized protein LOC135374008 isoform X2 n=1 Tax=Ornithodoros turicata TaxID=34597 RepID=UPI0031387079
MCDSKEIILVYAVNSAAYHVWMILQIPLDWLIEAEKYTVPAACFWIFSEIVQVVMQLYLAAAMMMYKREMLERYIKLLKMWIAYTVIYMVAYVVAVLHFKYNLMKFRHLEEKKTVDHRQQRFDMPEWDPELRTVREHIANIVLVTVTKVLYTMFFIWKFTTYLDKMAPSPASGAPTQPPDAGTGAAPVQPANAGVAPQNVGMWPAGAQYNQPYPLYGGAAQQCPAPVGGMGPLAAVQPGGVLQKM